ncbi:hypothetical protein BMS3Abin07_00688 [bacterium BMS3Abin07]|nr:hypothetical protein BMS3Abin07_00688 [bacterium BMS3Abin07]
MKPLFTIHAGEYLVGSYIENQFKNTHIWIPSKDIGIDLLSSDLLNKKFVSLQIKFSKDYIETHPPYRHDIFQERLLSCSWFKLSRNNIEKTKADLWIFIICGSNERNMMNMQYLIIEPKPLLRKLIKIYGDLNTYWIYFWITKNGKCWDTRGLNKNEQILVANDTFKDKSRDFTSFLNNWYKIEELNKL